MKLIKIENAESCIPDLQLSESVNLTINEGDRIAILGDNASGKSILLQMLLRKIPFKPSINNYSRYASYYYPENWNKENSFIKFIGFENVYGGTIDVKFYQQRWNKGLELGTPYTVEDYLGDKFNLNGVIDSLFSELGIDDLLSKELMVLSSGELRKIQLIKSLFQSPKILIVENPFIGLDEKSRKEVSLFLQNLPKSITLILVHAQKEDIPAFCHRIFLMKEKQLQVYEKLTLLPKNNISIDKESITTQLHSIITTSFVDGYRKDLIEFNKVSLKYGSRTILEDLTWKVRSGECWLLQGENGSGKSALLSLVCADNPQAYKCAITLFGMQRGHGESIWDIKKNIGFFSSEMYLTYKKNIPLIEIVASGLFDTIGLYKKIKEEEKLKVFHWIKLFGLDKIKDKSFLKISSGEQRLALIARAFVKEPTLLILDEPFQGLDRRTIELVKYILDLYFQDKSKSLIFVSHYKRNIPQCINRILTLQKIN